MRRLPGPFGVLAYHRVAATDLDPWALSVTPQHFDEQLTVLKALGRVENLDDALGASLLERCCRWRPTFAITFDDGYVDNLVDAVAILERHDAPATVFIATGMLDAPWFWWDVLADLALGSDISTDELLESAVRVGLLADVSTSDGPKDPDDLHALLYAALSPRSNDEISGCLHELSTDIGIAPTPSGRPLTTEELHALAAHPLVTIGIHTVNHRRLTLLPPDEVRRELIDGASRLDDLFGARRRVLAYPYGATSSEVVGIARSTGVVHGVTTAGRWVGLREDPMLIPRLHPHDLGHDAFAGWVAKA
jgi:peptidoglycan/xylan/chitin deacetylase (PgdA/CDA1 family)